MAAESPSFQLGVSLPDPTAHVKCMVITELCEKGDLFDYIVRVVFDSSSM